MRLSGKPFDSSPPRPPVVTIAEIEEARERIAPNVPPTPCRRSQKLSQLTGTDVYLKLENLHETGSFKERGAANALAILSKDPEIKSKGIVAASAGNHAQAVALHATKLGIPSYIVMPETAPLIKASRTAAFGGNVILKGESFDDALAHALYLSETKGYTFLPPFDHIDVITGQGTAGLEIFEALPDIGTVIVPIGGGGLISGIATAVKSKKPDVRIIGVEPTSVASMYAAVKAGHPYVIPMLGTIADGVAVRRVGERNLNLVQHYVDDLITVTESDIARAVLFLLEQEKFVAEGAGAVAIAAILKGETIFDTTHPICAVLSGGNIDVSMIARIIDRGLVESGRLWRVTLEIQDTPGSLAKIMELISKKRANIIEVLHERNFNVSSEGFGKTNVQLQLETKGQEHINEIISALADADCHIIDHI